MKVDFNGVRKDLALTYTRLINAINSHQIDKDGWLHLSAEGIADKANDLRNCIVTLCSLYEENNEEIKNLIEEDFIKNLPILNYE